MEIREVRSGGREAIQPDLVCCSFGEETQIRSQQFGRWDLEIRFWLECLFIWDFSINWLSGFYLNLLYLTVRDSKGIREDRRTDSDLMPSFSPSLFSEVWPDLSSVLFYSALFQSKDWDESRIVDRVQVNTRLSSPPLSPPLSSKMSSTNPQNTNTEADKSAQSSSTTNSQQQQQQLPQLGALDEDDEFEEFEQQGA